MTLRPGAKILTSEDLAATLAAQRADEGVTVALANGCFDLIHGGHINFLEGAAAEADILVVGVNADASVRRLKGAGRPVMHQDERARVVAALGVVDYVTIFDEPTADQLLETLRPDVHCKGTDYAEGGVPEAATVAKIGARIALVGGPKIQNTSAILETIRDDE